MEAATRVGRIKEILLQTDGERVAGFVVSHGETIVGSGGTRRIVPSSALYAIGPDAITVHSVAEEKGTQEIEQLPRMSDVVGRKMVTRSGRVIGSIDDLLINGADGKIVGFAVGESVRSKLENMFQSGGSRVRGYVRADADLQVGHDLIVVPDDALIEGEPEPNDIMNQPTTRTEPNGLSDWTHRETGDTARRSIWTRRTDPTTDGAARTSSPERAAEPAERRPVSPINH